MPNWCENVLKAEGKMARVFKESFIEKGFEDAAPMPKELLVDSGYPALRYFEGILGAKKSGEKERESKIWNEIKNNERISRLVESYLLNYSKYGFPTWYEWRIANWGTKWNVGGDDIKIKSDLTDSNIELSFDTAWSPPLSWLIKASKKYNLKLSLIFADPSMDFLGKTVCNNGDIVEMIEINSLRLNDAEKLIKIFEGIPEKIEEFLQGYIYLDNEKYKQFQNIWGSQKGLKEKIEDTLKL